MFKKRLNYTFRFMDYFTLDTVVSTIGRTSVVNEGNNKHTLPSTISELGEVQFGDISW